MKRIKNFLDTPITWGASIKAELILTGISVLIGAVYYVAMFGWWKKFRERLAQVFGK